MVGGAVEATVVDSGGGGSEEGLIIWLAAKYSDRGFSTLLYVDQVQKKQAKDLSPLEGDLPRFLGKGKRSIDLESVVLKKNEK